MNKNKLSRFLLSTSVGIIATLGISEVKALSEEERAGLAVDRAQQVAEVQVHRAAAVAHFKSADPTISDARALELANKLVLQPSGLSALNQLGDGNTKQLFEHFQSILVGGVPLTAEHFDDFLSKVADATTLNQLGVADVRQLKSPELERLVAPSQITNVKDAVYFAEQRKEAGEFKAAAEFFLKARDLTEATSTTLRTEYAEKALLMYSEHFIHQVARVSSVTAKNVSDAQSLLLSVKALAEETGTATAFKRAASCAAELGTAIYDLVLVEKANKAKLLAETYPVEASVTAASVLIAKLYVDLYNADIVARDMYEKAADKYISSERNEQFAKAADAWRLAIGALADAHAERATAVFSDGVTVETKLQEDAVALKGKYTDLADTSGVDNFKMLKMHAASATILTAKLKATWNARSRFGAGTAPYVALTTQYADVNAWITTAVAAANGTYNALGVDQYLGAKDIAAVRLLQAERLYRVALDEAAVDPINAVNFAAAVTALATYVKDNGTVTVVNGLDAQLKATLDEAKAGHIRNARIHANKVYAEEQGVVAKARSLELEKLTAATPAERAVRLESYLSHARYANNKAAWESGVIAADKLLTDAAIATPAAGAGGDEARLVKALALTAKAEALLRRNLTASDTVVAALDVNGVLNGGSLFDANATAAAIDDANRALRIRARKELRQSLEAAVELHGDSAVKQASRTVWADVEAAYAVDELAVADALVTNDILNGNSTFTAEGLALLGTATTAGALKAGLGILVNGVAVAGGQGGNNALAQGDLTIVSGGITYQNKTAAAAAGLTLIDFEDQGNAGPVLFSIAITVGSADVNAIAAKLLKCDAAGGGHNGTLAKHYKVLFDAPAVAVDGVSLDSLDTVEKLYNHLVSKLTHIRAHADHGAYKKYETAAKAFEKARKAKSDWAAEEVANLSKATALTYAAKRDAAGAAYTAAADYETLRLRTLLAETARGKYTDVAFDDLVEVTNVLAANNGRLASFFVTEHVLDSLRRRAESLRKSADAYGQIRPATTTDALIGANEVARNAAVKLAVEDVGVGNNGAFEVGTKVTRAAFLGLANYNAAAVFGPLVAERLASLSSAYHKVTRKWLPDLKSALSLTTAAAADVHRAAVQGLLQDGAAVDSGADLAGRVFDVNARFVPAGGANYVQTQKVRAEIARAYETVLESIVSISTDAVTLEAHQGHLFTALQGQAALASVLPLTQYVAGADVTEAQMTQVIDQLKERADAALAAGSAAYGATRSNTPSNITDSFKAARAQALDAIGSLIAEGALDIANVALNEVNAVATANLKAKAAHELAHIYGAKASVEARRYANSKTDAHLQMARDFFAKTLATYEQEVSLISSILTADDMPNRNSRLLAAYEAIEAACADMQRFEVSVAGTLKDKHTATFKRAQLLYREGHRDLSLELLEALMNDAGASVVHGPILRELAEEYESAGKFLKAAKAYRLSAINHVDKKEGRQAFDSAESALGAAKQSAHAEACEAAAQAFNAIGEGSFHGRVRAEAYHKAASAYLLGENYRKAGESYALSAALWAKIGDHMQAGNQYEKAAWALSKAADIAVTDRIAIIQYIEKAAHQLQITDATHRLEKLVELAEVQIAKIEAVADSINTGNLKKAVVAAAGALYEKALAFQKEGDLAHAEAAEKRIDALLKKVDVNGKEAGIRQHLAALYVLQKKHAQGINEFIGAAASYTEAGNLVEAAKMYAKAADAVIAGGQGARIRDEILPALIEVSKSVRTGGKHAAKAEHERFEIHLAILDVYLDLIKLHPDQVDTALAELAEVKKETTTDNAVKVRIAELEIALLSQKARTVTAEEQKALLVSQAQTVFDAVKGLDGATPASKARVKNNLTKAAHYLAEMYRHSKVIHSATTGLAQMTAFKAIVDAAEAAAAEVYKEAAAMKADYEVALEASHRAAKVIEAYTRAMLHYMVTETDKARTDDMTALRAMPDRMVKIAENAVRATLLGILKSREEAAKIQTQFVEVMDAVNKVNSYVVGLRTAPAARDAHGDAVKAEVTKAATTNASTAVKNVTTDIAAQAAAAHATVDPVERAAKTDALVAAKTEAAATAVVAGLQAHADLVKTAPAATVSKTALADTTAAITTAIVGDGKEKGLLGDLQKAQTGPSTAAAAQIVATTR
jgi:hypothetical protein